MCIWSEMQEAALEMVSRVVDLGEVWAFVSQKLSRPRGGKKAENDTSSPHYHRGIR